MAKRINYLNLSKVRLHLWKESENLTEKIRRSSDAVKPLSAITWKVHISMEQEIDRQARKLITTIQEKGCSRSKKENFVHLKNIEISSRCSLQF